ncbi:MULTISPECIES: vWA domain-containing protein [Rhizobium]|uniref:VWA domain-containing protein n=1 Tax=Rhizobium aouanii TaxID=3118145 RepID=A0ABU8CUP4_9HYPH|nr:VWA domain-containing protein [Rhizobium acaciae]MCW1754157.1 VWA domain-containing protein [Rhizobium acaciae]
MTRSLLSVAVVLLWLLLAAILALMGQHMLRACGIGLFGYRLSWCEASIASPGALQRQQGLSVELAALERQYRALPLCRADVPQGGSGSAPMSPAPIGKPPAAPGGATAEPASRPGAGGDGSVARTPAPPISPGSALVPGAGTGSAAGVGPAAPSNPPGDGPGGGQGNGQGSPDGASQAPAVTDPAAQSAGNDACQPNAQNQPGPVLLAIDHSRSMALPVDMDDSVAVDLEALMDQKTPAGWAAEKIYDSYIDQPGKKRLDVLKEVITRSIGALPSGNTVGLVTFGGCQGVVDAGLFGDEKRGDLVSQIQSLKPVPATPVAQALKAALARAKGNGNGRVVLVTDGRDTCGGDPCATARQNGGVRVDVLAIGGGRELACIAEATGGQLIDAAGATNIDEQISQLITGGEPSCH